MIKAHLVLLMPVLIRAGAGLEPMPFSLGSQEAVKLREVPTAAV